MCQIILIDRALEFDDLTGLLARSISSNSDGCGIAWRDGASVHYWRTGRAGLGELTAVDLADYIASLPRPVLVHTRFATAGGVGCANAHPFPLSGPMDLSVGDSNIGVLAHNGHLRSAPHVAALLGVRVHKTWSDTRIAAEIVRRERATIPQVLRWIGSEHDRAAVLTPSELRIVGQWSRDVETGLRVSSQAWLRSVATRSVATVYQPYSARSAASSPTSHPDRGARVWDDVAKAWWVCDGSGWRIARTGEQTDLTPVPAGVVASSSESSGGDQ